MRRLFSPLVFRFSVPGALLLLVWAIWRAVTAPLPAVRANGIPFTPGDVFAGVGSGRITHYKPDGTLVDTLNTTVGGNEQGGMCFDAAGDLFVTDYNQDTVSKFYADGTLAQAAWTTAIPAPQSCVVDAAGFIYVAGLYGDLGKFRAQGGAPVTTWTLGFGSSGSRGYIDLAADQCTLYFTSGGDVYRYNVCAPTSPTPSPFALGVDPHACYALRIRPNTNGEVMLSCPDAAYRLNGAGTPVATYPAAEPTSSFLFAMNLDPDGASFWTGGYWSGNIYRYRIADGALLAHFQATPNSYSLVVRQG